MTFPTTSTLDRFHRPNAANLGTNYSIVTGYDGLPVVAYHCGAGENAGYQVWSHNRFRINQQVWIVVYDTFATGVVWLSFRCDSPQPTEGYRCIIAYSPVTGTMLAHLYRIDTGAEVGSAVDLGIAAFTIGDLVGIDAVGYRFTLYYRPIGGASVGMGQWYDTNFAEPSYIGLGAAQSFNWWLGPWPGYDPTIPPISPSDVLIAYQPKAATGTIYERTVASYAASKINLANPGTYDAIEGVAPNWIAATGWTGTGTQWLDTTLVPASNQNKSIFAAYSGATNPSVVACGAFDAISLSFNGIQTRYAGGGNIAFGNNSAIISNPGAISAGVAGFSATQAYLNGTGFLTMGGFLGAIANSVYIFAMNVAVPASISAMSMQAFVWYSTTITDDQVKALSWAMNIIRSA